MSAVPANSIASAMLRQQDGMAEDVAMWRRPAPTAAVLQAGAQPPVGRRPSVTLERMPTGVGQSPTA